jgi:hypothetical protein
MRAAMAADKLAERAKARCAVKEAKALALQAREALADGWQEGASVLVDDLLRVLNAEVQRLNV